jgi:hypothetical protein
MSHRNSPAKPSLADADVHPSRRALLSGLLAVPALAAIGTGRALAQTAAPRPFNTRIVMSGHSLTDSIPVPLDMMVRAAGGKDTLGMAIEPSTVPGSPMESRWKDTNGYKTDARRDIGNFDVLVVTERVPLSNTLPWHDSLGYGLLWFDHAWTQGNGGRGAETILYATWIHTDSGPDSTFPYNDPDMFIPFRERLPIEMALWQQILDHVNANRVDGSPPMRMIPGPLIIAAAYDAIMAGTAPGLTAITDLFDDTIHINLMGGYLIALAHFAVIYRRDPRTIPNFAAEPGWPRPETADWMKALVWDVVRAYPDSGVS